MIKQFWRSWPLQPRQQLSGNAGMTIAMLAIAGLALKPPTMTNADTPKAKSAVSKTQATATARVSHRETQLRQIRPENFDLGRFPVNAQTERHWRNILWTTAVVEPQDEFVLDALSQLLQLSLQSGLSDSQVRTIDMATQVATQLYLSSPTRHVGLGQQFLQMVEKSPDPAWVAVALSGLANAGLGPQELQPLVRRVKTRFPSWSRTPFLKTTLTDIEQSVLSQSLPPLADLLNWTIAPRQLHAYVFCRSDRTVLCQMILKDRDGQFVRQGDTLWAAPLLLRSIHNLGWNFVRGQTPQGLYRIEGTTPQPDDEFFRAYGQFSLVNLFVPFEAGAKNFLPNQSGSFNGTLEDYQALLPPAWRNYWPMQQSYWSGKIGRSLFRIHGSGESPDFFSGKDRRPETRNWNPTLGCLSALELYNEQGQLLQSDMPRILHALEMVGGKTFAGYLLVTEVPGDSTTPVSIAELEAAIAAPQKQTASNPKGRSRLVSQADSSGSPTRLQDGPPPSDWEARPEPQQLPISY